MILGWNWDPDKASGNLKKHKISFETAIRIFGDPWAVSRPDTHPHEDRWQTIGRPSSSSGVVIFVVHTWHEETDGGRIISARYATRLERKVYEEGQF